MSQPTSSGITQNEINRAYNNRHAYVSRQTSEQSNTRNTPLPNISRTVSIDDEILILGRTLSHKRRQEDGNISQYIELYCGNQPSDKSDSSTGFSAESTHSSQRWKTIGIASRHGSNDQTRSQPIPSHDGHLDDVFIDEPGYPSYGSNSEVHSPVCTTTSVIPHNPYNVWNHKVHDTMWCSCCLYFFLLCCIPAVIFMEKSDAVYITMDEKKARNYGKVSTVLYISGGIISLIMYALLLFLVVYISTNFL